VSARPARAAAVLLPLLLLASCGAWGRDRLRDLGDVFTFEVAAGVGVSADVKATDLLHVGAGYAHGRKLSWRGRTAHVLWDREVGLPGSALLWWGALADGQLWRLGDLHTDGAELLHGGSPWRIADLEVGVFAGFVGLRLGLSPGELVDLLAGLVGLDPAGDDLGPPPRPGPGEEEEAGEWLVGDLHAHCDPPDGEHAPITPEETWELAAANGFDFVGINPHLWLRGRAPAEREGLVALGREMLALDAREGPLVVPGLEVMLRGRGRRSPPTVGNGHALLLFRDPEEAWAFAGHPAPEERAWVRERLATVPPERRLWVPTHPWPHPRIGIPLFPDWAAPWKQLGELPDGEVELAGRRYRRHATPWSDRDTRDGERRAWRLVRYALAPEARAELALAPADDGRPTREVALDLDGGAAGALRHAGPPGDVPDLRAAVAEVVPGAIADDAAEVAQATGALGAALRRALDDPEARAPDLRLEVVLPVARNGWLWGRVARRGGGPAELELAWGATAVDADGAPHPPLHEVPIDGLETLSGLVHLAGLAVGRRGAELDRDRVFEVLEARMLAERRRLVPLAGSDNHRDMLYPTLWVFARERTREAVFDALRAGRVCVGGPEARSLRARTDRDPLWRAVGAAPRADRWVELRWRGQAELFVDGRSRGRHTGGFRHEVEPGSFHLYRIVRGPSWSGWIYVNLPGR